MDSALDALYLMFNEGYSAHEGEDLVRQDVCFEALRLGRLMATSSLASPKVHALTALMALKAARLPARTDVSGDLILLEHQDRELWDQRMLALGFAHFERSMEGDEVSRYHVEAAIAATHARGEPWHLDVLADLYDQLLAMHPSPVVALNRAVVTAKREGAAKGLAEAESLQGLSQYYLWYAVRGHLLLDLNRPDEASACFREALSHRCSHPERRFLETKIVQIEKEGGDDAKHPLTRGSSNS